VILGLDPQPIPVCKLLSHHAILASRKNGAAYFVIARSPSADGRKLHPHPDPLPSRERGFLLGLPRLRLAMTVKKGARNDSKRRVQAQNGRWVLLNGFGNG